MTVRPLPRRSRLVDCKSERALRHSCSSLIAWNRKRGESDSNRTNGERKAVETQRVRARANGGSRAKRAGRAVRHPTERMAPAPPRASRRPAALFAARPPAARRSLRFIDPSLRFAHAFCPAKWLEDRNFGPSCPRGGTHERERRRGAASVCCLHARSLPVCFVRAFNAAAESSDRFASFRTNASPD